MRDEESAEPGEPSDDTHPEPMNLLDFLRSSPPAEAIAAGEFELPERPRDAGREFCFDPDDSDA